MIIESQEVASAASGKAGGFLARDWGSGVTEPLHIISFDMHVKLAKELDVKSFRYLDTLSVSQSKKIAPRPDNSWLDRNVICRVLDKNTAQVDPKELTDKMLAESISKGTRIMIDKALHVKKNQDGLFEIILRNNPKVISKKVLICMGPWSGNSLIMSHETSS